MTVEELGRLYRLKSKQERLQKHLKQVRSDAASIRSPRLDGMPKASQSMDSVIEKSALKVVSLEEEITELQIQIIQEEKKIRQFISTIPESKIRLILVYRHIDGLNWSQIGTRMKSEESAVKIAYYRFMRSQEATECAIRAVDEEIPPAHVKRGRGQF